MKLRVLLILFASASIASGQDAMTKLRLAQSFEQANEWERAASLYEDLHRSDMVNYIFYDGLLRSYTQLKQYEKATALVAERMQWFPKDAMLRSALAGLEYDAGNEHRADSLWRSTIASDPKNVGVYRIVAAQMLERRLYDQTIRTYGDARKAFSNDDLFADELGTLYSALQQYDAATREFLRLIKSNPSQLSYVQTKIGGFTIRQEGITASLGVVREAVAHTPNTIALRVLLAWLAGEAKEHEQAFQQYVEIDRLSRANGNEMFGFAQRLLAEKVYSVAAKAFRFVIEESKNVGLLPQARFGFARCIEELSLLADTSRSFPASQTTGAPTIAETRPTSEAALRLYEQLSADYKGSEIAAQAWYRTGVIRMERLWDLDGAAQAFMQAKQIQSSTALDAAVKLAEALLCRNELPQARKELAALTSIPQTNIRDHAMFSLAELDYFENRFDDALLKLHLLDSTLNRDWANDALMLEYFIIENKSSAPQALAAFAAADLLARQRKFSEALVRFESIVKDFPAAPSVDDALVRAADLQLKLNRFSDGLATFQQLLKNFPVSVWLDKAQFLSAETYDTHIKDKEKAIAAYEELLAKYPNSLYAEEARRRIRRLRGESL